MPRHASFADLLHDTSPKSAAVIVPMLMGLCTPKSVLDVGCGVGAWLAEFIANGVSDIHGIDTFEPSDASLISGTEYEQFDLTGGFMVGRSFDLAICLEVGEHLPAASSPALVASLVKAAPVVAFSAAIPGQFGPSHINMQWPSYWRILFEAHGYRQFDPFRARLWDDDRVAWWYRQNIFVYSAHDFDVPSDMPECVVHPGLFADRLRETDPRVHSIREVLRAIPSAARVTLRNRMR